MGRPPKVTDDELVGALQRTLDWPGVAAVETATVAIELGINQHVVSVYPVGSSAGASWACSHLVLIAAPWGRGLSLHPTCEEGGQEQLDHLLKATHREERKQGLHRESKVPPLFPLP